MGRYNAWYNGSTTLTLTGNPAECPDVTLGPLSNALAIGGMTVPGNASLDRSVYDKNPFYFYMPHEAMKNLSTEFQSSTDYYIDETQSWRLFASKSGDGYDITGYWIGTLPSANFYYHEGTKCWDGGDNWPNTYSKSSGENVHWNITARITRDSATWTFDQTWINANEVEWHTIITFKGQAYSDGPRLVTTGDVPTTEGCLGCKQGSTSNNGGSSGTTASAGTGTATGSSSSASSTSGSSTGDGMRCMVGVGSVVTFGAFVAAAIMVL